MIQCGKCQGKVFVDLTFTDNVGYETFCLRCGKRTFINRGHSVFDIISAYVAKVTSG